MANDEIILGGSGNFFDARQYRGNKITVEFMYYNANGLGMLVP
jgi:hypothetical protein